MIARNKRYILFFILIIIFFGLFVLFFYNSNASKYENIIREYLSLREKNDPAAFDLCYFKPEYEYVRDILIADNSQILDTEILNSEKVNENLHAFFIRYELEDFNEESYSFVARIHGNLYVIVNIRDIPEELKENFDYEKFSRYLENGKEVEVFF